MPVYFRDYLNEQLKNPEFRAEYELLEAEYALVQSIIDARHSAGLTQEELAAKSGIKQSELVKLENGQTEPTLRVLLQLARGMGKRVTLSFEPA